MAFLYFMIGAIIFVARGIILDDQVRRSLYDIALHQTGVPVEAAIADVQRQLLLGRTIMLMLFAGSAFALAEVVTRPLKRAAQIQERFVANVSHELRTPLAIMKTGIEVRIRNARAMSSQEVSEVLAGQLEQVNRLSRIIQFLLDFSDFDKRHKCLTMAPISLKDFISKMEPILRGMATEKEIAVIITVTEGTVLANYTALEEILLNLFKNAVAYTQAEGRITVCLEQQEETISLRVEDTGVGISDSDMKRIFEPFFRGSNHTGRTEPGLGIGLSIVKELVHLQHGSVHAQSALGKGSTFTVLLPMIERF